MGRRGVTIHRAEQRVVALHELQQPRPIVVDLPQHLHHILAAQTGHAIPILQNAPAVADEIRRGRLFHEHAGARQRLGSCPDGVGGGVGHWRAALFQKVGDGQLAQADCARFGQRHGDHPGIDGVRAADERQRQGQVSHAAGDQPDLGKGIAQPAGLVVGAGVGHAAGGRLEAGHAAVVGRQPQHAAGVTAQRQGCTARSHQRSIGAAAAARCALQPIGVERAAIDDILRVAAAAARRTVGLAQEERAGQLEARQRRRIRAGNMAATMLQPRRADQTGCIEAVVGAERDPMQRPLGDAARQVGVGPRRFRRGCGRTLHQRVDRRVDGVDARLVRSHDLRSRDRLVADTCGEFACRQAPPLRHPAPCLRRKR